LPFRTFQQAKLLKFHLTCFENYRATANEDCRQGSSLLKNEHRRELDSCVNNALFTGRNLWPDETLLLQDAMSQDTRPTCVASDDLPLA
jgi:hypothetical protein